MLGTTAGVREALSPTDDQDAREHGFGEAQSRNSASSGFFIATAHFFAPCGERTVGRSESLNSISRSERISFSSTPFNSEADLTLTIGLARQMIDLGIRANQTHAPGSTAPFLSSNSPLWRFFSRGAGRGAGGRARHDLRSTQIEGRSLMNYLSCLSACRSQHQLSPSSA